MRKAGVSQRELAGALGITEAQVSRLISGKRNMKIATAEAIVAFLCRRTGQNLTLLDILKPSKRRGAAA